MTASWLTILIVAGLLVPAAYLLAARSERPRFVVVLVLAAVAAAVLDLFALVAGPAETYGPLWFGQRLAGTSARVALAGHAGICLVGAVGLWRLRAWARLLAMAYLGYLLASFLIWGVRGTGNEALAEIMLWQMIALPFLTFCLMYLQRGGRYFRA